MIEYSFSAYDFEYFLLILTRVSCFIFVAPFFSMNNTPRRVRVGLSLFTAGLLYLTLTPIEAPMYDTIVGYATLVIKEAATGLLIGLVAMICTAIVNFAGVIVDMEIGLSMVSLMDPTTRQNISVSAVLYQYVLSMMMITTGMYRYLLGAIADSFILVPVSGAVFRSDFLLEMMLSFMRDIFIIGFRICLPVFCVAMLLNSILGILARVAPQMNMFAVGIQLRISVGLTVLLLTVGMLQGVADFIFTQIKIMLQNVVKGGLM